MNRNFLHIHGSNFFTSNLIKMSVIFTCLLYNVTLIYECDFSQDCNFCIYLIFTLIYYPNYPSFIFFQFLQRKV